jgi:hypothetical protein
MSLLSVFQSCSNWAPVVLIRDSKYGMPAVQSFHLMGLTVLLTTVLVLDLRLAGLGRRDYGPKNGVQVSNEGVLAMPHWRAGGKEIFFRGQELDSNDLVMMAADVETTPTFRAGTPKVLFRLPGPINGSLGAVSRDGQRFVLAVNVPADKAEHPPGVE